MRAILRLIFAATLFFATCLSYADGPGGSPCIPGSPGCGGSGGVMHLPTNGLTTTLVRMR